MCAVVAVFVFVQAAAAGTIERVRVGGGGRNATHGFSTALFVDVSVVGGYTHVSNDGDEGGWDGPMFHATGKPDVNQQTHLAWGVGFFTNKTLKDVVRGEVLRVGSSPIVQQGPMAVPHFVGGRRVGAIAGFMMVTQAPGSTAAAFSSAVAFPLCHGAVSIAKFHIVAPATNAAQGFGTYVVDDGTDVQAWDRAHIVDSLKGVVLDGPLPAGRLTAVVRGRVVTGTVRDCAGHPAPGAVVFVGKKRAVTTAAGAFTVRVAAPGSYLVSVTSGGGSARRTVHVR